MSADMLRKKSTLKQTPSMEISSWNS